MKMNNMLETLETGNGRSERMRRRFAAVNTKVHSGQTQKATSHPVFQSLEV